MGWVGRQLYRKINDVSVKREKCTIVKRERAIVRQSRRVGIYMEEEEEKRGDNWELGKSYLMMLEIYYYYSLRLAHLSPLCRLKTLYIYIYIKYIAVPLVMYIYNSSHRRRE